MFFHLFISSMIVINDLFEQLSPSHFDIDERETTEYSVFKST
jgi:hypothetical protein